MAPEIFRGLDFNPKLADIYSMGIVLFMMLFGFVPYSEPQLSDRFYHRFCTFGVQGCLRGLKIPDHNISADAMDLVQTMVNPSDFRIDSCDKIANHPWLKSI